MEEKISPARGIRGTIHVPGDKSISHRYAILAAVAEGGSEIFNYSTGADCQSTLACLRALGVRCQSEEKDEHNVLTIAGEGLDGLKAPADVLNAGNSGSTMRMLAGVLAAQPFTSQITGDSSLAKRPMQRIIAPLSDMGARIEAKDGEYPPLRIDGTTLHGIDYELPIPSAQVKSCILLAGLNADSETVVRARITTRDHTELALREFGADIDMEPRVTRVRPGRALSAKRLIVPGDLSSAAFFIVAALMLPGSDLIVANVGLNPTRTALLDVLRGMGANIRVLHIEQANGELLGNLRIKTCRVGGGTIQGAVTAAVIDEIPILSVLGAVSERGLLIRDAGELRVKETDRIEAIANNLRRMGIVVNTNRDSIEIPGRQSFRAADIDSCGDHRIAMAFSIAALAADGVSTIQHAGAASVSFPGFYSALRELTQ